jgi:serine/threonine-protein kinase
VVENKMSEAILVKKIEMLDKFIGKTLADKYRIESGWRKSGLGKVYHATHLLMDKPVAVKVLSPALAVDVNIVNRFSAEARTVSGILHPNVLNVTDFGTDTDGAAFIVMEDAEGETVKESLKNNGAFTVERAVKIARQIASALSAAHAKGVIHKHLNSESVLLAKTENGAETVKVLDFGAVKPQDDGLFAEDYSAEDLQYVAPEQISATFEPDQRSDIYSLGVILYEMLAGEVPFTAETSEELLTKQAENPPPPFSAFRSDLPEGLEPVVLRALANNPEIRYQNVNEFAEDLAKFSKDSDVAELAAAPKANSATATNNIWKTAFVVLAGISLLAVAMIYATSSKQANPITQMQTDAGGLPVQPLNPATGINEQNLVFNPDGTMPEIIGNSSMPMPDVAPGGDGYDPWARGGAPPPGAPNYPNGGQVITIPGDGTGSQFMPGLDNNGGYILIPVPVNTNTSVKPTPTPKDGKTPLPANTQVTTEPKENPTDAKPEAKPTTPDTKTEKPPTTKPTPKPVEPKSNKPVTSNDKKTESGKEQDAN